MTRRDWAVNALYVGGIVVALCGAGLLGGAGVLLVSGLGLFGLSFVVAGRGR